MHSNIYYKKGAEPWLKLRIERSTFLISEKAEILHEWRKVKVDGHAQEVLDYLLENG